VTVHSLMNLGDILETGKRAKAVSYKPCERCGSPIPNHAKRRFCSPCSDLNTMERQRRKYHEKKVKMAEGINPGGKS